MRPWPAGWNGPPTGDLVQKKENMFVQYKILINIKFFFWRGGNGPLFICWNFTCVVKYQDNRKHFNNGNFSFSLYN